MTVHRLIFRWDFALSTKIFDHPGEVMDAIGAIDEARWQEIEDTPAKRSFGVKFTSNDKTHHRSFNFEPTSAVFSIEWLNGVELKRLEHDQDYLSLCSLLDKIKEVARLKQLRRSGIRFHYLSKIESEKSVLSSFTSYICKDMADLVEQHAGPARDIGIKLDGSHEDGILYHFQCGPYSNDEKSKFFVVIDDAIDSKFDKNFIIDADFYELNFVPTVAAKSWAAPVITRFDTLVKGTEKLVAKDK